MRSGTQKAVEQKKKISKVEAALTEIAAQKLFEPSVTRGETTFVSDSTINAIEKTYHSSNSATKPKFYINPDVIRSILTSNK